MKYIRTKDGVYLNGGRFGKPYVGIVGKKREVDFGFCFDKKDIIKQADTIEELCDELIYVVKSHKNPLVAYSSNSTLIKLALCTNDIKIIYGAIWTDKGLIYVAKMNDKGELELL